MRAAWEKTKDSPIEKYIVFYQIIFKSHLRNIDNNSPKHLILLGKECETERKGCSYNRGITLIKFVQQSPFFILVFARCEKRRKKKLSMSRSIIRIRHDREMSLFFIRKDFADFPRTVKHVNMSWLEETAARSRRQDEVRHAVQLAGDYCDCLHR